VVNCLCCYFSLNESINVKMPSNGQNKSKKNGNIMLWIDTKYAGIKTSGLI